MILAGTIQDASTRATPAGKHFDTIQGLTILQHVRNTLALLTLAGAGLGFCYQYRTKGGPALLDANGKRRGASTNSRINDERSIAPFFEVLTLYQRNPIYRASSTA